MNEEVMMMNETEALMQESGAADETNEAEEAGTGETQDEALEAVKAGVARLYEDGWSAEELTALSQDEGARRDIARGIGVERAALNYLRRGRRIKPAVPTVRRAMTEDADGPDRIDAMTDEQFDAFSRKAWDDMMAGRRVKL